MADPFTHTAPTTGSLTTGSTTSSSLSAESPLEKYPLSFPTSNLSGRPLDNFFTYEDCDGHGSEEESTYIDQIFALIKAKEKTEPLSTKQVKTIILQYLQKLDVHYLDWDIEAQLRRPIKGGYNIGYQYLHEVVPYPLTYRLMGYPLIMDQYDNFPLIKPTRAGLERVKYYQQKYGLDVNAEKECFWEPREPREKFYPYRLPVYSLPLIQFKPDEIDIFDLIAELKCGYDYGEMFLYYGHGYNGGFRDGPENKYGEIANVILCFKLHDKLQDSSLGWFQRKELAFSDFDHNYPLTASARAYQPKNKDAADIFVLAALMYLPPELELSWPKFLQQYDLGAIYAKYKPSIEENGNAKRLYGMLSDMPPNQKMQGDQKIQGKPLKVGKTCFDPTMQDRLVVKLAQWLCAVKAQLVSSGPSSSELDAK